MGSVAANGFAPPPAALNQLSDLIALFRNLDRVEALVGELQEATAAQNEALKAQLGASSFDAYCATRTQELDEREQSIGTKLAEVEAEKAEATRIREALAAKWEAVRAAAGA